MGTSCIKMLIVTRRHNLSKVLECCLEHQVAKHPPAKRGTKQMTHPKPVSACGLVPLQPLKVCWDPERNWSAHVRQAHWV